MYNDKTQHFKFHKMKYRNFLVLSTFSFTGEEKPSDGVFLNVSNTQKRKSSRSIKIGTTKPLITLERTHRIQIQIIDSSAWNECLRLFDYVIKVDAERVRCTHLFTFEPCYLTYGINFTSKAYCAQHI